VSARAALIITADDYGYAPAYDRGIVEAASAGALDAVSVMALRAVDPTPLLVAGVEVGLHLELPEGTEEDADRALAALREQLERFEAIVGRPARHLDGHHHCHARGQAAEAIAREAAARGLPVRSVSPAHRGLLRSLRVATPDRLVGRTSESEPALPEELREAVERGTELPAGVTEWMVHPGRADPDGGSSYDRGREEDLDLLLRLRGDPRLSAARLSHAAALL
jgi:chitin disaccharide deacetylase